MKLISAVFTFLALAVLVTAPANAQATRTWVSGVGDDANPCSRTAPCKTFAGAISKTAAGGEISVLDPGGFGAVTITKAITINGDGQIAGITASLTNGVIVNAGVNDRVVLRNIAINGVGNGLNGIRYLAGKSVTVDNVTISGFTGRGIDVSATNNVKLFVRNTRITNAATGIFFTATGVGQQAQVMVEDSSFTGLGTGLEASTNGRATISNSVISGNTSNGILASQPSSRFAVDSSQISFNDLVGVNCAGNTAIIRLSRNEIVTNNTGITINAGCIVESSGDNVVSGNVGTTAPNAVLTVQ